jgi:two-component system cell cycle response regulator
VEAIRRLRASVVDFLPVVAVIALGDSEARRIGLDAGAEDFVTRPLSEIDLQLRVRAALRLKSLGDELARVSATLAAATTSDPLTSLHNARAFASFLDRELARSRRYARALSLLVIDVDGLRRINEINGHGSGDRLLCNIADVVRREIRVPDVAARDEGTFRVLAPETAAEAALSLAERLRREVNHSLGATVSIGVAAFP